MVVSVSKPLIEIDKEKIDKAIQAVGEIGLPAFFATDGNLFKIVTDSMEVTYENNICRVLIEGHDVTHLVGHVNIIVKPNDFPQVMLFFNGASVNKEYTPIVRKVNREKNKVVLKGT